MFFTFICPLLRLSVLTEILNDNNNSHKKKKYVNREMFLSLIVIVSPAMHSDAEISQAICEKN